MYIHLSRLSACIIIHTDSSSKHNINATKHYYSQFLVHNLTYYCTFILGADKRHNYSRVRFSSHDTALLNISFEWNPYPSKEQQEEIASILDVSMEKVITHVLGLRINAGHSKVRIYNYTWKNKLMKWVQILFTCCYQWTFWTYTHNAYGDSSS